MDLQVQGSSSIARWLCNGGVTCLCGSPTYRTEKAACSGKSGGVRLRLTRAKAAYHPVSRQSAQTSGVRKRLPFSTGVVPPLYSHFAPQRCSPILNHVN